MAHKIADLIKKVPEDTVQVKKDLAEEIGVHADTVNRWYNNPETKIDVNTSLKILSFFKKYFPELAIEDLFTVENIATDSGLI